MSSDQLLMVSQIFEHHFLARRTTARL